MKAASSLLCGTGEISFEADLVNELNFDQFLDSEAGGVTL